jgi:exopolyphosphatase / guanosine-5'-triphosphate,3'-diphosphate pyrophosphatase
MANQGRCLAAMDIGSNSVRLMIAELKEDGTLLPLKKELVTTRIYEGLARTGKLSTVAVDRTLAAINILKDKARETGADSLYCFATAAVREAKNRDDFLLRAARETSMTIDVLSEETEARVGFIGTMEKGPRGALDIGGGSTEIALGHDSDVNYSISMKMGAVRALEKYPLGDIADPLTLEAMRQWIACLLNREANTAKATGREMNVGNWAGIGGTITTLAAMDLKMAHYDSVKVQGHSLSRQTVDKTLTKLATMPLEKRQQLPGLMPERADIIIGGVAILLEFMLFMDISQISVSDRDNLEGYLTYKLNETNERPIQ